VHLGAGAQMIGAVVGTFSLAALLARPAMGATIDRVGKRSVALRFLLIEMFVIALYLPLHSIGWQIFAVRALHGASEGVARVALFAMVYEILPEGRRGEGMATFSLCGMIPGALAPLAGEELIKRYGFQAFFGLTIFLCVTAAIATYRLPSDKLGRPVVHTETPLSRYVSIIKDRGLMPLWVVTLLFSLALSSRFSFVAPYAYQQGITRVAWYFFLYSAAAVALRVFGARVMDRIGLERTLVPALLVLGVGLALLSLTGRMGMLELAALIGGVGHGYAYPALSALVIGRTGSTAMGSSSTVYTSLYDVGMMAGPYMLGVVAHFFGYAPMFVVAGTMALGAGVYFAAAEPRLFARRLA